MHFFRSETVPRNQANVLKNVCDRVVMLGTKNILNEEDLLNSAFL